MEKKVLNPTKLGYNVYVTKSNSNTSIKSNHVTTISNKSIKDSYVDDKIMDFEEEPKRKYIKLR